MLINYGFSFFLLSLIFVEYIVHWQKEALTHNATKISNYAQCTDKQKNKVIFLVQQKKTQ